MRVGALLKAIGLIGLALVLNSSACVEKDALDGLAGPPDPTPVDNRYCALGNSLTAGFINSGLLEGGQRAAYPVVLARQAGWAEPSLPIVAAPGISATPGQSALFVNASGKITSMGVPSPLALLRNAKLPVPYDDLGVPGAFTRDLLHATNTGTSQLGINAFFDIVLRNTGLPPGTWTALDQMTARNPSALTLWIGSNDVLFGAFGGEPQVGVNITPPEVFEPLFVQIAQRIFATNATFVAVGNIVDLNDTPYLTAVPLGVDTPGGFVRWQMEEDTESDPVVHVLLSAPVANSDSSAHYLPAGVGFGDRVLSRVHTLTRSEAALFTSIAASYNVVIAREAAAHGWAYVNVSAALSALPRDPAEPANFEVLNAIFPWLTAPGSSTPFQNRQAVFSLDGLHPGEKGQAFIANLFIAAMNTAFALGIPPVDPATVSNTVGFEQAPVTGAITLAAGSARFFPGAFTEVGRSVLRPWSDLSARRP